MISRDEIGFSARRRPFIGPAVLALAALAFGIVVVIAYITERIS